MSHDDTKNETQSRRLNQETIKQRKKIIGFIQDSSVNSYDIAQYMDFDKVKCNNMLRAMEEDNIIMRDGIADAHPSGRGRPPFMWKLVNASFWAQMHGKLNEESTSETSETSQVPPEDTKETEQPDVAPKVDDTKSEETKVEQEDTQPDPEPKQETNETQSTEKNADARAMEESIHDKVNRALHGNRPLPKEKSKQRNVPVAKDESKPTPKPAPEKPVTKATSDDTIMVNIQGVQTVLVHEDNSWCAATAANINEYAVGIGEGSIVALNVPLTCSNVDKYIKDHEEELVF